MNISEIPLRIDPTGATGAVTPQDQKGEVKDASFGDQLRELLYSVNDMQASSDEKVSEVITGESEDLHNAMIALEEANVSFQLMLEIRNKMLEAYQEINRMNI